MISSCIFYIPKKAKGGAALCGSPFNYSLTNNLQGLIAT